MKKRAKSSQVIFASFFVEKYFGFSKMDKKNVQKRKGDILLCKILYITINLENKNIIANFLLRMIILQKK